jgi:hypothetical protein
LRKCSKSNAKIRATITDEEKAKRTLAKAQWCKDNKDKKAVCSTRWYSKLTEEERVARRLTQKKYANDKYKNDINFRLAKNLRSRLRHALRSNRAGSPVRDLGCSIEQLKVYIEQQFVPGMSWDNYTYKVWHIDHIKPLSKFDLSDPEQFKEACHYTNLRPLWAKLNLQKNNK